VTRKWGGEMSEHWENALGEGRNGQVALGSASVRREMRLV
jgi:hypothetical protein